MNGFFILSDDLSPDSCEFKRPHCFSFHPGIFGGEEGLISGAQPLIPTAGTANLYL